VIIRNGRVLLGREFCRRDLQFDEKMIAIGAVGEDAEEFDADGCYVLPGLVDIHTHGGAGADFSDGDAAGLETLSHWYARNGVTTYLATTMTLDERRLTAALTAVRGYEANGGARCGGIHLEGPFLSREKRGAQNEAYLRKPDAALFARLNEAGGGKVKLLTLACEEEGAMELIRTAAPMCTVSLGHTGADYDSAMAAFSAGARHVTHLYNGMAPLHHRSPGLIGAAFDAGATVELICDGCHVHPGVVRATFALFGERVCLISDSLRCAGMENREGELGAQAIEVRNGCAYLRGTDTLAGSAISLLEGMRRAVSFGIPLNEAAYAASTAPAMAAGLTDAGRIELGKPADLIVLDEELKLKVVFIDGRRYDGGETDGT